MLVTRASAARAETTMQLISMMAASVAASSLLMVFFMCFILSQCFLYEKEPLCSGSLNRCKKKSSDIRCFS